MNHVFCTECGSKIEYSYAKPKFCSNCGTKTGAVGGDSLKTSKNNLFNKNSASELIEEESLAEDETSVNEVPDIRGLAVETESYGNNVFSFQSLVGEKDENPRVRNRGSKTLEDFIDDRRG